jgi:hypothetical protein
MKRLLLALLVGAICPAALGAEPKAVSGAGGTTCAAYAKNYPARPQTDTSLDMAWTQGFMSALNATNAASRDHGFRDLDYIGLELQEQNLREYCLQHPLANFVDAAMHLYTSLPLVRLK